VGRRYAAALADVVVVRGEAREVQEELAAWALMLQANEQLLEVFRNPTVPYEQKRGVLDALIARAHVRPTTANFLRVLLQNQRLVELGEINKRFASELDKRAGIVSAHVTTARPVPEEMQAALRARLEGVTGQRVRLQFSVDEQIIGGVVTRIGSTIYDGSIKTRLEQAREKLAGASQ
jgi:F-type H+-transporting ATPase subunit delta